MRRVGAAVALLVFALWSPAYGQDESAAHAALRQEGQDISGSCTPFSLSAIGKCVYTFATANPIHATFGSIAPDNGVAVGPAIVGHATPSETLRVNWSTDAVATGNGSWRAGAYLNFVRTAVQAPVAVFGNRPPKPAAQDVYPVYSLFAQAISLNELPFYGEGHSPPSAQESLWAMREVVGGVGALVPVGPSSRGLALTGGAVVRSFDVRGRSQDGIPAIDVTFMPNDVPGLDDGRTFLNLSEGVRAIPAFGVHVLPLYEFSIDEFWTAHGARESFTRLTANVVHEFPFYQTAGPSGTSGNSPNDCSISDGHTCAAPSRNRYGSVSLRLSTMGSAVASGSAVPFYLQPTLGGTDINGQTLLGSFPNYFFRAPNLFVMQATAEHSLFAIPLGHGFALPLGAMGMVEEGSVAERWPDVFHDLSHSYGVGLTIRAGGFPAITMLYASGPAGHHVMATISPSLLGGASRPSLF